MKPAQVVVKFLDGRFQKGRIDNFQPQTGKVILNSVEGGKEISLSDLKAIFFLREPTALPVREEILKPGGTKVKVLFADGEEITGYTYAFKHQEEGFFLYPISKSDSNERIYVIKKNAINVI
jgi:Family of unknown function (DUF6982)